MLEELSYSYWIKFLIGSYPRIFSAIFGIALLCVVCALVLLRTKLKRLPHTSYNYNIPVLTLRLSWLVVALMLIGIMGHILWGIEW